MAWGPMRSGRSLDRLINFSDAVVAVAITLLALQLVDIPGPQDGQTMWDVIKANWGQIQTFVLTFLVVAVMWSVHNRIVNHLIAYDSALFWLIMLWLLGFVFLPWPSRLFESTPFSSDLAQAGELVGPAMMYWLTLAYISFIGAATARHMTRHPELIAPKDRPYWDAVQRSRARWRGSAYTSVFLLAAVASYFLFYLGNYVLLLLIPLSLLLKPPPVIEPDPE
ncbi:MAG: DUF1211 domain-containing protein [Actinomycetales bacterium]|nr:DUF1211 domain-containing protein [Actinomycetales bacterium]